jgi:hypothetical protein
VIHVYAVLDAGATVPGIAGLAGRAVEAHRLEGLTVAASTLAERPRPTTEAALRHGEVVEALAAVNDAVLPVRFGSELVPRELDSRRQELLRSLDRVRGCVEVGVRALRTIHHEPGSTSGSDYLRSRLAEVQEIALAGNALHRPLAACARATVRRRTRLLLDAAYLVPQDGLARFRQALAELAAEPGTALVSTGPWPPYSFAAAA